MAFRLQWSFRRGLQDITVATALEAQTKFIELHNVKMRKNVRIFDSSDRELAFSELTECVIAENPGMAARITGIS
jgi:succinate dehydrogenase flavin-adding protein (antitoxin of CptAB toxin-antitoxin module)